MAEIQLPKHTDIDPRNGYSSPTKTYHSLRPAVPLPPSSQPHSVVSYALSLLHHSLHPTPSSAVFLTDAATGHRLTYSTFLRNVNSLSSSLSLSKSDVAFVLAPPSLHVPVLYFALLSLGVVLSPTNPLSSPSDLIHQIRLSKPSVAFSTSALAHKLPPNLPVVLLDSPQFLSMLDSRVSRKNDVVVDQSDPAAILFSSGTTGKSKGVVLTHRNLIAVIGGFYHNNSRVETDVYVRPVSLFTLPLFHVFGFFMLIRAAAMGESLVLLGRFDFPKMLEVVEKYRVTYIPVAPPVVVAMANSDLVSRFDLSSLQMLGCGGAPLGKEISEKFKAKFPQVEIVQGYGMTETAGAVARIIGPEEAKRFGSAGRLCENVEAKIVDPESGVSLPPGGRGELWLRAPVVMKGYAGDEAATAATVDSGGWLKTGDICYFDSDGFLFIVDRLKELIKYKGYQVPPVELEQLLLSMPDIADAAVIPYPDEEAGEIPIAYVVRKPGSTISAAGILDSISKQVSPYKRIRRVAFVNSIPKSPAGKILRRELINHALSNTSSKL